MQRLAELGIDVPGEVSVAGFDDIATAAMATPGLSTVRLPLHEIGRRAFGYAERVLAGEAPPREVLPTELVLRGSTAPPPAAPLDRRRRARRRGRRYVTGDRLAGRVVLVTGSSRGIGAEIVVKAAEEGATVALHYHQSAAAAQATLGRVRALGGEAESFGADIGDGPQAEALVAQVIERFGRVDALVNNAGQTLVGPFLETEPAAWDEVLRTDLSAAYHTCRAVLPSMVERGDGTIVNIASRLGQIGVPNTAAYSAAKAGLIGLTRALASEFGPRGSG